MTPYAICTGSRLPPVEMLMARLAVTPVGEAAGSNGPLVGRCGVCMRWVRVDNGVLVVH